MDSFNGTNMATEAKKAAEDEKKDGVSDYTDLDAPNISVAVAAHDLSKTYGDTEGLSDSQLSGGSRSVHFAHADAANNTKASRVNSYTWHHLQDKGKMELIDMNVHGAMWHYGGISGWKAATHPPDDAGDTDGDNDPS